MTNQFLSVSTRLALALSVVTIAGAPGCGGNEPTPPAHSSSFFPVRGTTDSGAAASTIQWVYRVNGGQPLALSADPTQTIRFGDEEVTARDGSTITKALDADLAGTGVSGHESVDETDHLTPGSSPATISDEDVQISVTLSGGGVQQSVTEMFRYAYGATPLSTFFDRDDLDSLALGFSESQNTQAVVTGMATATVTGAGTQSQAISMTLATSTSWTLVDKLATFQVLGHDYTNVVEVQTTTLLTDPSTGTPQQGDASIWLAKGIGMIRQDQTSSTLGINGPLTTELVSTNLVP